MPPTARHSQAACLAQTALHGPPVETERGWGFNASVALECGPPVSPPVALMDLSRQCRVWKGTLPSPVGVFNTISCLFGSHLTCRVYSMLLPSTSWEKGGCRGKEKVGLRKMSVQNRVLYNTCLQILMYKYGGLWFMSPYSINVFRWPVVVLKVLPITFSQIFFLVKNTYSACGKVQNKSMYFL